MVAEAIPAKVHHEQVFNENAQELFRLGGEWP